MEDQGRKLRLHKVLPCAAFCFYPVQHFVLLCFKSMSVKSWMSKQVRSCNKAGNV